VGGFLASCEGLTPEQLAEQGLFTFDSAQTFGVMIPQWTVEGLLEEGSLNLLIGHSNLGKTPLCITLGVAIAAGVPFLGHSTTKGPVLYLDAESTIANFMGTVENVSKSMGLPKPPEEFKVWSPNWGKEPPETDLEDVIFKWVESHKPSVVIVDTLGNFFPIGNKDREQVIKLARRMRRTRTTWLINHHRRKDGPVGTFGASLIEDPHRWSQEAAGSLSLINHVDGRFGVDATSTREGDAEIVFGGFLRHSGKLPPLYLAREYNAGGVPVCYRALRNKQLLSSNEQEIFAKLSETFRFKDLSRMCGGSSGSGTTGFLKKLIAFELVKKEVGGTGYRKLDHPEDGVGGASPHGAGFVDSKSLH